MSVNIAEVLMKLRDAHDGELLDEQGNRNNNGLVSAHYWAMSDPTYRDVKRIATRVQEAISLLEIEEFKL